MQRPHHLTKTRGDAETSSLNKNKREVTKRIPFSPSYSFSVNAGVLNVCEIKKLLLVVQNKACVCKCTLFCFLTLPIHILIFLIEYLVVLSERMRDIRLPQVVSSSVSPPPWGASQECQEDVSLDCQDACGLC